MCRSSRHTVVVVCVNHRAIRFCDFVVCVPARNGGSAATTMHRIKQFPGSGLNGGTTWEEGRAAAALASAEATMMMCLARWRSMRKGRERENKIKLEFDLNDFNWKLSTLSVCAQAKPSQVSQSVSQTVQGTTRHWHRKRPIHTVEINKYV